MAHNLFLFLLFSRFSSTLSNNSQAQNVSKQLREVTELLNSYQQKISVLNEEIDLLKQQVLSKDKELDQYRIQLKNLKRSRSSESSYERSSSSSTSQQRRAQQQQQQQQPASSSDNNNTILTGFTLLSFLNSHSLFNVDLNEIKKYFKVNRIKFFFLLCYRKNLNSS